MLSILLLVIIVQCYIYFRICFGYWKRRALLSYPNPRIPLGHVENPFKKSTTNMGITIQKCYTYFREKKQKHGGIYMLNSPIYVPVDLDIIKDIAIKYFDHFDEKGLYYNEEQQQISAHLFLIGGARWKKLRVKISPTFTSVKMKMMFPMVMECMQRLVQLVNAERTLDVKNIFGRFTVDVIGSCAFGIECDSFASTQFHQYCHRAFATDFYRGISKIIQLLLPKLAKSLGLVPFPRECNDFFVNVITDTVKMREESNIVRNDFVQLLMGLKNSVNPDEVISMNDVISQGFVFFVAGFETTSATLSFCLFELSKHPDIQQRAREECLRVFGKHGDELNYDALSKLHYVQQIIEETLRLYPPLPILNRECTKDFRVDGVLIEKGTKVFIPCYAIHRDPNYYANPEEFNPERFSEDEKRQRHPFAYLPFGEGPRQCIGMRFAFMEMKICLAYLLKEYSFSLHPSTKQTLSFDRSFVLSANEKILLNCSKLCKEGKT